MAQTPWASPQHGGFDSPFFRSKFRVPSEAPHFVRRPRLVRLLADLSGYPIIAVVAPAGAGKTALAADWLRLRGDRAAWLALDASDTDERQLLTALASAVDPLAPGCVEATVAALRDRSTVSTAVHALIEVMELSDGQPTVLVVDDLHHIDGSDAARAVFDAFVEHRPAWLSLLLLSRRSLPLPVDRLRAGGLLADITFDTLRFSQDEALEMLAGLCPHTPVEDLGQVAEWGSGWAAALQLAALAVRSRQTERFQSDETVASPLSGTGKLVDEYLWHEVLLAEAPEVVDLLLGVSVVDRVNYPMAEALTERSDAGDLLVEAERRGVFVTGLRSGGWFEVHALVRDALQAELGRRWPAKLREQHARAARWFETADDSASALEHWLAADMPRQALRLLAHLAADLFDSGRQAAIRRTLDEIEIQTTETDRGVLIELAWCLLHVDRRSFDAALAALDSGVVGIDDPVTASRLAILRAAGALISGSWRSCEVDAGKALDAMADSALVDPLCRFGWGFVAHGIALDERWSDTAPEVVRVTRGASHDAGRALALEGVRAIGSALAGRPLDALRTTAAVRQATESADMTRMRAHLDLAEAVATRELGDRDEAHVLLSRLAEQAPHPDTFVPFLAQVELVELHLSGGSVDVAESAFRTAEATSEHDHDGPGAISLLSRHAVQLHLARRDLDEASAWAERIDDAFWRPVSDARILLARQRTSEAAELLALPVPRCERHAVTRHLLLAQALRDADRESAGKQVAKAVEIAAGGGMLETVGFEGRHLLDLLELVAWRVPEGWMKRLRRVVIGGEEVRAVSGAVIDELTVREREVLRLLPTRLTLREVADELFVSYNTLKFHLRVIYQKLGVNSRAEAVEHARRLGLMRRAQ